ncbi:MAG: hypothetical protein PVF91_03735 [Chromatiales bacterium]|jgi:hypothetical protein
MSFDDKDKAGGALTRMIGALVGVCLAVTAAAVGLYLFQFAGMPVVTDPEPWGRLGDFLGGILTPLVGLLLLIGAVRAMLAIRDELAGLRAALERAAEALPRQDQVASGAEWPGRTGAQREDLYRTIEVIHRDIRPQLAAGVHVVRTAEGVRLSGRAPTHPPSGDSRELTLEQVLREAVQDPVLRESVARDLRADIVPLAELMQHLARCLHEYEGIAGARGAGSYFRRRYALAAVGLQKLGVLPDKVGAFFRDARNGRIGPGDGEHRRPEAAAVRPPRATA